MALNPAHGRAPAVPRTAVAPTRATAAASGRRWVSSHGPEPPRTPKWRAGSDMPEESPRRSRRFSTDLRPEAGMQHVRQIPMAERDLSPSDSSSGVSFQSLQGGDGHRALEEAVQFGEFVTQLVAVRPEQLDDAIQSAMDRLMDPLDLDQCAVFLMGENGLDLRLTHHRTRAGTPEPPREFSAA